MIVTKYPYYTNTSVVWAKDLTWPEVVGEFLPSNPNQYTDKFQSYTLSGAELAPGATRADASVVRIHWFGLDFDGLTEARFESVMSRLAPFQHLFYTSWSHHTDPYRFRAIVPISRTIEPQDWEPFKARVVRMFPEWDIKTRALSQQWLPAFCAAPNKPLSFVNEGERMNVDKVLQMSVAPLPDLGDEVTLEELGDLARKTKGSVGQALLKVYEGAPFASLHDRDTMLFKMCSLVARTWPSLDPTKVAELFGRSLDLMARESNDPKNPCPTRKEAAKKLKRAQLEVVADITRAENEHRAQRGARLAELGRSETYSADELNIICTEQGVDRETLRRRWIIQKDKSFYLLKLGGYAGPYTQAEVSTAALRDLAPAASSGVHLYDVKKGKPSRKPWVSLIDEYGTVATKVRASLVQQKATYDGVTLTEAPCPLRDIQPKQHHHVHYWLGELAGELKHKLYSWVAAATLLDKPCAALLLFGAKGVGKSLLAQGLSRLYSDQPTDLQIAMERFNASVMACPLIFADETIPKDFRGLSRTGDLRRLVQDRSRLVQRKYLTDVSVLGAVRIIIAANNSDILSFHESLNEDDLAAITERFLNISVGRYANQALKGHDTTKMADLEIAEHALWLRDNYKWEPAGRFLVSGDDAKLYKIMSVLSGSRADVLRWLIGWLQNPERLASFHDGWVKMVNGDIVIHPSVFERYWTIYQNARQPTTKEITRALKSISSEVKNVNFRGATPVRCHVVQWEPVALWCEATEYVDADELRALRERAMGKVPGARLGASSESSPN